MLLVKGAHRSGCRGNHIVDEEEERVLGPQVDTLSDQEVKLANSQIGGHKILFLVKITNSGLGGLFNDDGNAIRILFPDLLALGASLLKRMFFLILELHLLRCL